MKKTFFILILSSVISCAAQAQSVCASFFENVSAIDLNSNASSHTSNFKPRYFSVSKYKTIYQKSELSQIVQKIKNLQQFVDSLERIQTYIENEVQKFFVANELVPIVDKFLEGHGVKFEKIIYGEESRERRTYFAITPIDDENTRIKANNLNQLARILVKENVRLIIDPLDLFYDYESITQTEGHLENLDDYTRAYVMSLHILLNSQARNFSGDDFSHDSDLRPLVYESKLPPKNKEGNPGWLPSVYP